MQQVTINVATLLETRRLDVLLNFLRTLNYLEIVNKAKPKKKKMTQTEMAASFRLPLTTPKYGQW